MKILSVPQIRACENKTLLEQHITALQLMERAAMACFGWIRSRFDKSASFVVICGMGNNGGDGLALTRLLLRDGYAARAIILRHADRFAANTSRNLISLQEDFPDSIKILEEGALFGHIATKITIIDALFGIGLTRPLEGWLADFVEGLNLIRNKKISIDIPSGLYADNCINAKEVALKADDTLTFQAYKRSFYHVESAPFVGKVSILDIGLSADCLQSTSSQYHSLHLSEAKKMYRARNPHMHKGEAGTAALVGGSYGKIGAIVLAAQAALRVGAGKVFVHAPTCGYEVVQASVPEAMFESNGSSDLEQITVDMEVSAGLGPGMGVSAQTANALASFLKRRKHPLVMDADGLNIIAGNPSLLGDLPTKSILTPHPKEFMRLFGEAENSMLLLELARYNAMKYNILIVLKGHHTAVALPDGSCWYNTSGNAGMATAGSGDVLTGVITGLLAQGYAPEKAALFGVYIHGLAGDLAAAELTEESMIAGDLNLFLAEAFKRIKNELSE